MANLEYDIAQYIQNRIFTSQQSRSELYQWLENLCSPTGILTENLIRDIKFYLSSDKLCNEFLAILLNFQAMDKPVMSLELMKRFQDKLPRELYLSFIRIFNQTCCKPIPSQDFGYQPISWDFGVALYITSTIPDEFIAEFEYSEDNGRSWQNTGELRANQLSGIQPIPITSTSFWSRLRVVSPEKCIYYSEISTITTEHGRFTE
jgi:hypothetical protein